MLGASVRIDARRSRRRYGEPRGGASTPAQKAAGRVFAVNVAIGALALVSVSFVLTRLAEIWKVGPARAAHSVTVLGQAWSYPAANAGAIALAVLAGLGVVVLVVALRSVLRELRADAGCRGGLTRLSSAGPGGARIIEDDRPQAFCVGLLRPHVYVSRGALEMLEPAELRAVLEHERQHARRRDPLRLASVRVLGDALFFLPPLRELVGRAHSLAEIGADEAAVAALDGDRASLASAMLSFSQLPGSRSRGVEPERVDHLLGEGSALRFPFASLLLPCACIAALLGLTALLAGQARASATLAAPFVTAQPCVVTAALIPAALVAAGLACARRRTQGRSSALRHHAPGSQARAAAPRAG